MSKQVTIQAWWVDGFEVRMGMCKDGAVKGEKVGFKWVPPWMSNEKLRVNYGGWLEDIYPTRELAVREALQRVKCQMELERLGLESCDKAKDFLEMELMEIESNKEDA